MSIFSIFNKKKTAHTAKNRLSLMLATERSVRLPYMEEMQREILEVVKKYTKSSKVNIRTDSNQNINALEIEVVLGE